MDYYSPFWGPKVISHLVEPQGALTCRSSTLIVLADSAPFHGLLLTILGSKSDFQRAISTFNESWGAFMCRSSTHAVWPILDRFLDYCSLFWGPEAISIVVEPEGALTCWSSTLIVLANSGPFRGLLLIVLGSRSDFHD